MREKTDSCLKRNKTVMTRFTELEFELIRSYARDAKKPVSTYVHDMAVDGKAIIRYEFNPPSDELAKLAGEYGKIGSNLNQIARHLNEGGCMTDGIAADIRQCIADLYLLRNDLILLKNDYEMNASSLNFKTSDQQQLKQ